jgi:hypothetical protein
MCRKRRRKSTTDPITHWYVESWYMYMYLLCVLTPFALIGNTKPITEILATYHYCYNILKYAKLEPAIFFMVLLGLLVMSLI